MIEENSLAEWLDNTATGGYLKPPVRLKEHVKSFRRSKRF